MGLTSEWLGQLFCKPVICCPTHGSSSTCARGRVEGLLYKSSRPMNIQTFPSLLICVLAKETGYRNQVSWPLNALFSQPPHGANYTTLFLAFWKLRILKFLILLNCRHKTSLLDNFPSYYNSLKVFVFGIICFGICNSSSRYEWVYWIPKKLETLFYQLMSDYH